MPPTPVSSDAVVIDGRTIEISQSHLLGPFLGLLEAIESLAAAAADGERGGPDEEACVRTAYHALYGFFHALLPSASHEAINGLTYAVALLLVAEAIEASRAVVVVPLRAVAEPRITAHEETLPGSRNE